MTNEIVKKSKKRYKFSVAREKAQVSKLCNTLPDDDTCYKIVSVGSFSCLGFIEFIASQTKIKELTVSTLRVGKKHLKALDMLYRNKKLERINFIIGSVMKNDSKVGKSYGYYENMQKVCENNNWITIVRNNHSKILLFDTDCGKYVLETSSNLNENPKMEQFSFYKDEEMYNFYKEFLIA
jgi:hypothetical protein